MAFRSELKAARERVNVLEQQLQEQQAALSAAEERAAGLVEQNEALTRELQDARQALLNNLRSKTDGSESGERAPTTAAEDEVDARKRQAAKYLVVAVAIAVVIWWVLRNEDASETQTSTSATVASTTRPAASESAAIPPTPPASATTSAGPSRSAP